MIPVVIGMHDVGPAALGPGLARRIDEAKFLVGGERHLAFFPDPKAEKQVLEGNLKEAVAAVQDPIFVVSGTAAV